MDNNNNQFSGTGLAGYGIKNYPPPVLSFAPLFVVRSAFKDGGKKVDNREATRILPQSFQPCRQTPCHTYFVHAMLACHHNNNGKNNEGRKKTNNKQMLEEKGIKDCDNI